MSSWTRYQRQTRMEMECIRKEQWPHNSHDLNPMDYHVWGAMLEAYLKLHPKPKSIPELKKRCRWFGTVCHRNILGIRLLKDKSSHDDWRDAQNRVVDISSTQSDYETSDRLFTVFFQCRCFSVFRRKHFSARENRWMVTQKSINSLYLRIIKCRLAFKCRQARRIEL